RRPKRERRQRAAAAGAHPAGGARDRERTNDRRWREVGGDSRRGFDADAQKVSLDGSAAVSRTLGIGLALLAGVSSAHAADAPPAAAAKPAVAKPAAAKPAAAKPKKRVEVHLR